MTLLLVVILLTIIISALCSLMEGFVLSITTAEIEAYKEKHSKSGERLERYKKDIEGTSASILTLNTIVNVGGSAIVGYLAGQLMHSTGLAILTAALTLAILFFSEILPKNIAVFYRRSIIGGMVLSLRIVRALMRPVASLARKSIRALLPKPVTNSEEEREQEILLLINKGMREGIFSITEREIVSNALQLDDVEALKLMVPLDKVLALEAGELMSSVLRRIAKLHFSRLPVYENARFIGYVTREDLLHASALDNHTQTVRELTKPLLAVSSTATMADLLQTLLKNRQEICAVEGPTGQVLGIVTMTDVVEHLLGKRLGITPRKT